MFIILLMSIVLCAFILWWRNAYKDPISPPVHPGALPIIGNAHQFLGDNIRMWQYIKEMSDFSLKSGGVSTLYLGWKNRIYFLTDPDDCLTLSNACIDKPFIYDIVKEWTKNGLIAADVSSWKPHRKLLNPMFSHQILNENLEIFNSQARWLVDRMSIELGREKFDSSKYIKVNTMETVCLSILGIKGEHFEDIVKDYSQATHAMQQVFIAKTQKIWLHIPFIFERSEYKKTLNKCVKITVKIMNEVIENRRAELTRDNFKLHTQRTGGTVSFLDRMLELQKTEGSFTDEDIRDHLEAMVLAGYDSLSDTLTFCMKLIGSHELVQQKIYEELQEVLGDKSVDVTRYDLSHLVYLEAVVKETLRMYSTVPLAARSILKDVKLKNYTLRAGSIGVLSSVGIHRHPMWGLEAEKFRPERWLEATQPVNDNPNLFAAFSFGKRNCIGKYYAMISLKTTLAHFLRHYRIIADNSEMTVKFDIAIRSVSGHEITLEKRKCQCIVDQERVL